MTNKQTDHFRPPFISAAMAMGLGYGANHCYQLSQMGSDWAGPAALATGGMAFMQGVKAINDHTKLKRYRESMRDFRKVSIDHGQSYFEKPKRIKEAGLFAKDGVFLGKHRDARKRWRDLRVSSENSGIWLAPPGSGKSAGSIINTALTHPFALIINDSNCEILATTQKQRRRLGNEVFVLTPRPDEVERIVGSKVKGFIGLNPYATIDWDGNPKVIQEELTSRSKLWIPGRPNDDDKARYFQGDGCDLLDFCGMYLKARGHEVTLPAIREVLLSGRTEMEQIIAACADASDFAGVLSSMSNGILNLKIDSPEQYAGGYGTAKRAISWAAEGTAAGDFLSGQSFDVSRLKDNRPPTVYVCFPGETGRTLQPLVNAVFTYLWRMIAKDTRHNSITSLIDEAAGLGFINDLCFTMENARKHQHRLYLAFQEVGGQLESVYGGRAAVRRILAASETVWASCIREPETLEMLHKLVGSRNIEDVALNRRSVASGDPFEGSHGRSHKTVPLLRPEEIRRLPDDEALIIYRNLNVIRAKKSMYYKRRDLRRLAGPNPYYKG